MNAFFLQDGDFTLQIKNCLEMCWHETLIQAELQGTSDVMCPYFLGDVVPLSKRHTDTFTCLNSEWAVTCLF